MVLDNLGMLIIVTRRISVLLELRNRFACIKMVNSEFYMLSLRCWQVI